MIYECAYVDSGSEVRSIPWSELKSMRLKEVTTGGEPRLSTEVQACWTDDAVHIRFDCEEDHVVATMTNRDDPLYEEDVVEVFIDESGTGTQYFEFEVSPRNVVFDAVIRNDTFGSISINREWNADGLETSVSPSSGRLVYTLKIAFGIFSAKPRPGTQWRWNLYRIDSDRNAERHYWAWSPTGAVQFHLPRHFGTLHFAG